MAADSTGKSSCWRLLFSLSVRAQHNIQAPEIFSPNMSDDENHETLTSVPVEMVTHSRAY